MRARQVGGAAAAGRGRRQVLVVRPLCVSAGHVPLFWQLWGDGEGGRGGRLGAALAGRRPQLVGRAAAARRRSPSHHWAGGHAGRGRLRVAASQRTGGDAGRRRVPGQRGAGLAQTSLQGGSRRCVGGHRAVEGVGAARDSVDTHDLDLGAVWRGAV